nr:RCC1 domain-containing protein [Corallococcus coralloides]
MGRRSTAPRPCGCRAWFLRQDGTVWAWGWNDYGQLGDGTTTDRLTPVQLLNLRRDARRLRLGLKD